MKKQTLRNLFSGLLFAVAVASSPQLQASETIGTEIVDGIEWSFIVSDGEATVGLGKSTLTAIPTNTAGDITIPSTLGGVPVTTVGPYAFYGCTNVTSFTLPGSVTSIEESAFALCSAAKTISVPDTVTNFGASAFYRCAALQQCIIPPLVEVLPPSVFADCVSFREVVVPDTVKRVLSSAFGGCTGLVSATVNATEEMWASSTSGGAQGIFNNCSLATLTIRCPVVGKGSLYGCYAKRLVLEEGVERIEERAFWSSRFAAVSFPDSLMYIDGEAFSGLYGSGYPRLPYFTNAVNGVVTLDGWVTACVASETGGHLDLSGVRGILPYRFRDLDYESVSMPDIRVLGSNCFASCLALQSVSIGGQLQSVEAAPFSGCTRLKEAVLEQGAKEVFGGLFSGCSGLEHVTLPDSVTSIGDSAFSGCTGLTQIDFPPGITNIGQYAFQACRGLKSVEIPRGVENLSCVFQNCTGLESVCVPASVTNATEAFAGCPYIRTATVPGCTPLSSMFSGCYYSWTEGDYWEEGYNPGACENLTSVSLAKGTTAICENMFRGCKAMTMIDIPEEVATIGNQAFRNCEALVSVAIPDGVTSIGADTFSGCNSLVSVALGAGLIDIGAQAFSGCSALTSANFPSSVTSIGDFAFSKCTGLVSATIPASVTNIGNSAFYNCSALQDIYLSDVAAWCTIPFGNSSASPFYYAQNLYLDDELVTALEIPDGVASIGDYAFYNCDCLESVSIPDSVTNIGNQAFSGCDNITWVRVPQCVMAKGLASVFNRSYQNLRHLSLGADVATVGANEFNGCNALSEIEVAEGNPNYAVSADGCLYDADMKTLLVCPRDATGVTIPDGVEKISNYAFQNCTALFSLAFPDTVASIPASALNGCGTLWSKWYRTLANLAEEGGSSGGGSGSGTPECVSLTVTNVIVHYVTQSVPGGTVSPATNSTGIVNIIAEVTTDKAIAISEDWAKQYPAFAATFGTDFSAALTKPTGKRDGAGNPMYVWQDYVAGTDPTDPTSVFTASVTFDAETGAPIISWSPELSPAEAAKRIYTTYGKVRLTDPDWLPFNDNPSAYNFFRVTVEMK